jgi:hypothetical protein
MLLTWLVTILVLPSTLADTTVIFGVVKRDLTGDSIPEVLALSGAGNTIDSLEVTFTIQSSGKTTYSRTWRLTRASFNRRRLSDAALRARLAEYGREFFAESKFMSPKGFLSWLQGSARLHVPRIPDVIARDMTPNELPRARSTWDAMQGAGITVFQFSPGGDAIRVIGWSATDDRFYDLLECC